MLGYTKDDLDTMVAHYMMLSYFILDPVRFD
jgi:hypothetical protein